MPEGVTALIGTHFNHFCAALIVASLIGAGRLTRAVRSAYGTQTLGQIVLVTWLILLVVVTYKVPGMGAFAVGLVVPLFADTHLKAWIAEQLGAEALLQNAITLLRKRGPMRFVAVGSIAYLLDAGVALIIVTVSKGRNSWEYWLGCGMLWSAVMGVVNYALMAWRHRGVWRQSGSEGAA